MTESSTFGWENYVLIMLCIMLRVITWAQTLLCQINQWKEIFYSFAYEYVIGSYIVMIMLMINEYISIYNEWFLKPQI